MFDWNVVLIKIISAAMAIWQFLFSKMRFYTVVANEEIN